MKIKLCVVGVGVHLEAMSLSYVVGGVENKEQRSKDASLCNAVVLKVRIMYVHEPLGRNASVLLVTYEWIQSST